MINALYRGRDNKGPYYQWGKIGTKFYYTSGGRVSREKAKKKACRDSKFRKRRGLC